MEYNERWEALSVRTGLAPPPSQIRHRPGITLTSISIPSRMLGVTIGTSGTNARVRTATSLLGQYNDYVYGEILEYSQEKRSRLRESGII